MEYWTTECEQELVGIHCPEKSLSIEERLFRSDRLESAPGSTRPSRKMVQGCFITALIGLFIHISFLVPVSLAPEPAVSIPSPEPVVATQDFKVSRVSIPVLDAPVTSIAVDSPDAMMNQLKELGLWDLQGEGSSEVPPVVFANFPDQLRDLDVGARKKIFLHSLLPVALVAMAEVEQERAELQRILEKLGDPRTIVFSDHRPDWQKKLSKKEKVFIVNLTEKYRSHKATDLLYRVDVLPVSLVLAQGAFESFWGTSRFAREGNNLFGMWTWGDEGIIPARRDPGKTHKLAIYDSILDAVRTFVLTINRLPAYKKLRRIRHNTMDSLAIADGLYYYSERGKAYITDVKTIIRRNHLTRFDSFVLDGSADRSPALTRVASL